jgi:hypothetical protein
VANETPRVYKGSHGTRLCKRLKFAPPPRPGSGERTGVGREFGFWLVCGVVRHRRLAGRLLAPGRAPEGHQSKKMAVSLGCRGLLGPPDGVWGRKNAPRGNACLIRGHGAR